MNLLIITHLIPYPLSDGGRISQYALLQVLQKECSVTLVVFSRSKADTENVQKLQQELPDVRIEIISLQKPLPPREKRTVGRVFRSVVEFLLHQANKTYGAMFKPSGPAPGADEILLSLVDFTRPKGENTIDQLLAIVATAKPDIIQLEFVDMLDIFCCLPDHVPKVFVHHELRFVRVQTESASLDHFSNRYGRYLEKLTRQTEMVLLANADGIITLSEEDRNLLTGFLPQKRIISSPFPVLDKEFRPVNKEPQEVDKLVFVGGEFHSPNKDAVQWYIETMADNIFTKYKLVLHVIGNWSEETIHFYRDNPAVKFTGHIEDVGTYVRNSIMLVPLRIGSGIRYKILYAAAWGIPVVSTSLGCQGIKGKEKICLIADHPIEFAEALDNLITDSETYLLKASSAQESVRNNYAQKIAAEQRLVFYNSVLHRQNMDVSLRDKTQEFK